MPFVLAQLGLPDEPWTRLALAAIGLAAATLTAAAVHLLLYPLAMRLAHRTPTELDGILIRASRWPVSAGIVQLGLYLSLVLAFNFSPPVRNAIDLLFQATAAATFTVLMGRLVSRGLDWAIEQQTHRPKRGVEMRLLPMVRRILVTLTYGLGVLLVLSILGIPINPLIAGLGLGGVAVGLAIRPTLSNLFAGTYVMTEGVVSPGDYIEMEGGVAGYVLDVGWRSTRLRTWGNNLVVVPNARFAETIITNYYEPEPPVNVFLTCGVSYDSDLSRVEAVSMDVMTRLLETSPHGVKEYGAYFGYDTFGESNIDFWLFVQAKDRLASFELRSALIHELHRRFDEEGITISYPVRALRFPNPLPPTPNPSTPPTPTIITRRPPPPDIPNHPE